MVRKNPTLILPLACRIPGVQAKGPEYRLSIPMEREVFGEVAFTLKLYLPGEGPFGNFTRAPRILDTPGNPTRVRRDAELSLQSANDSLKAGSRVGMLYLTVLSNCSIGRAEMVVSNCIKSETEDFATYSAIVQQGLVTVYLFPVIFQKIIRIKTRVGSVYPLCVFLSGVRLHLKQLRLS